MLYLVVMAHLHALTFAFWGAVFCNLPDLAISCYLPASRLAWALALTVPNLLLGLLIGALQVSLALAAPALALQLAPLAGRLLWAAARATCASARAFARLDTLAGCAVRGGHTVGTEAGAFAASGGP